MVPLAGFSPDADQTLPGVISDCTNFIPYLTGMEGAPAPATPAGVPVLAAACQGAAVLTKLDDSRRIVAGTQAALYELLGGAWTNQSKSGGYAGGVDSRWSLTQFGDATLAANGVDPIQRSASGAFASISGAPVAEIVFSVGAFVMALNTNDGSIKPDGWHCCAAYDDTTWAPSISTQCTTGRLVSRAGRLTAGARLGEYAVAYKARSIYLGQYVGAPAVWDWLLVPGGEAGCIGKDAVCDIGGAHFFVGEEGMFIFDGTRPVPVADGVVRQWFANNSSQTYRYKTQCAFDAQNNRVWVFYVSKNGTALDSALVYHVLAKKWGRADPGIESVLNFISAGATIDGLTSYAATIDALPTSGFNSQFWISGGKSLSVFNTTHQLQSLTGNSVSSSFTTGESGDDNTVTLLSKLRLRYADSPDAASCTLFYQMSSGEGYATGITGTVLGGKFDVLQCSRWHKAQFSFTGKVQVTQIEAQLTEAGQR
ncbi:hypothetical protein UFOVP73_56 [uncultured Caudovirales phage]|uniref:Uncharacterized protein n=1 Tax=uncultured Caudovirales phage TaxID=2100421 RepID=A0A6J7WB06_9CAUD|nr:hypothetical protein UFOVP73_56 [uncultured Caudovirales phage]CAB5194681.1 hypothetical protein UFOVP170_16 [uncultured Caudovirales phage]